VTSYSIEDDRWLTFGLAFVGGYGDAAGFILGKTFTGHVTGNLVLVAISLVARDGRSVFRQLLAIALFLLGVVLSTLVARTRSARSAPRVLPYIMLLEVALMGAGAFILSSQWNFRVGIFLACVSLALGLQNGAFRHAGGTSVHTTYLTGMTTNLIASVAGRDDGISPAPSFPTLLQSNEILAGIWIAFVAGAAAGAAMMFRFGGLGMLGAATILLALALRVLLSNPAS
jgi:uncharacterized membrane protein YoaK (UPF0700 family)